MPAEAGNISVQLTGLRSQLTYVVFVAAVNVVGAGEAGIVTNARTGGPAVPSAPSSIAAVSSDGGGGIVAVGLPINDGGAYPTAMVLTVTPAASQNTPGCAGNGTLLSVAVPPSYLALDTGVVQVAVGGLVARCTHSVEVAWVNAGGTGPSLPNATALTTGPATPPAGAPPTPSVTSVGPSSVGLCWPGEWMASGGPVVQWRVYSSQDGIAFDAGLVLDVGGGSGSGGSGGGGGRRAQAAAPMPTWEQPRTLADALHPPLVAVRVSPVPPSLCLTVPALRGDTLYFFSLRAVTALGTSSPSTQPAIVTTAGPVPAAPPTNLRVLSMSPSQVGG